MISGTLRKSVEPPAKPASAANPEGQGYADLISRAIEAGKTGDIKAALAYSAQAVKLAPPDDRRSRVTRGWAIYKALRQLGKDPGKETLPPLATWFRELEQDTLPKLKRPDLLFSMLLNEYCRLFPFCPQAAFLPSRIGPL